VDIMIGGYTTAHLLKRAEELVKEKMKTSAIIDEDALERMPKFDKNELTIGRVLGRGGFCVVSEIKAIRLADGEASRRVPADQDDEHQVANAVQDRSFMQHNYLRGGKDTRYAIKILKSEKTSDPHYFINGIVDLAIEAKFLSVIRHPNVVKMRALACGTPFSRDYFVVLDRLYDILTTRLISWRKRKVTGFGKVLDRKGKRQTAFWLERITVAYDLSCALKYLHGLQILYRDLKPDNIGFDVRGDVKIFDFGLAKEFYTKDRLADGTYRMTGDTGSPRYMAPEVALELSYNETADVYSFSILAWQILDLSTPFENFNMTMFDKKVVRGGFRPKLDPKWPANISKLLAQSWHSQISERPTMERVVSALRDEINSKSDEEVNEFMDASRRSEMSQHVHRSNVR